MVICPTEHNVLLLKMLAMKLLVSLRNSETRETIKCSFFSFSILWQAQYVFCYNIVQKYVDSFNDYANFNWDGWKTKLFMLNVRYMFPLGILTDLTKLPRSGYVKKCCLLWNVQQACKALNATVVLKETLMSARNFKSIPIFCLKVFIVALVWFLRIHFVLKRYGIFLM